eukprot:COSAG04_NODE_9_length_43480_cov_106.113806_28_plen_250_part_00
MGRGAPGGGGAEPSSYGLPSRAARSCTHLRRPCRSAGAEPAAQVRRRPNPLLFLRSSRRSVRRWLLRPPAPLLAHAAAAVLRQHALLGVQDQADHHPDRVHRAQEEQEVPRRNGACGAVPLRTTRSRARRHEDAKRGYHCACKPGFSALNCSTVDTVWSHQWQLMDAVAVMASSAAGVGYAYLFAFAPHNAESLYVRVHEFAAVRTSPSIATWLFRFTSVISGAAVWTIVRLENHRGQAHYADQLQWQG